MSTDPSLALQAALVNAIRDLNTTAGANVFDTPPTSDLFPRVTVGPGQTIPLEADCYDGSECYLQIDVWSRAVGYPEAKGIADAIRGRLHNGDLTLDGHVVDLLTIESIVYSREQDGLTSRARITLRAQTQPDP